MVKDQVLEKMNACTTNVLTDKKTETRNPNLTYLNNKLKSSKTVKNQESKNNVYRRNLSIERTAVYIPG